MASYIVAVTGASGAAYGIKLLHELTKRGDDAQLIISPSGFLLLKEEVGLDLKGEDPAKAVTAYLRKKYPAGKGKQGKITYYRHDDLYAPPASGSSVAKTMIICPCSMGTLARAASGISSNLIGRAADCVLKERGTLIVVPRETPFNVIHLENMLALARAGAVILPAMPAFYQKPRTIDDMIDFVVGKVLDVLRIENTLYKRWNG